MQQSLRTIHWFFLIAVYGTLTMKAVLELSITHDYLIYHLPRALDLFGQTTFIPGDWLLDLLEGHPPFAHVVQGLLVTLTGRMSMANAHNALAWWVAIGTVYYLFRDERILRWMMTFLLAVPLFLLHFFIGYIDLFTGCLVFIGFVGLCGLAMKRPPAASGMIMVFGFVAASLTKVHAWAPVFAMAPMGMYLLYRHVKQATVSLRVAALLTSVLVVGIAFFPVRNALLYGSVTHPFQTPIPLQSAQQTAEKVGKTILNATPSSLHDDLPPVLFFYSAYELNRFLFPHHEFRWKHDQWHGNEAPHHRMGGWFILTALLTTVLLFFIISKKIVPGIVSLAFLTSIIAIAVMPMSHNLRYWFCIPLCAMFLIALSLDRFPRWLRRTACTGFLLCSLLVLLHPNLLHAWRIDGRTPAELAPQEARDFWQDYHAHPWEDPVVVRGKRAAAIFWSGPTFNEVPVQGAL